MKIRLLVTPFALSLFSFKALALDFKVIDFMYTMPSDTPWLRVFTNQAEWEDFYLDLLSVNGVDYACECGGFHIVEPVRARCQPPADFTKELIVVGGVGIRYSGASNLVVTGVSSKSYTTRQFSVLELLPVPDCMTATVIKHPMVGVTIMKIHPNETFEVDMQRALVKCN